LGTAAVTTRGFDETAVKEVAAIIAFTLKNISDPLMPDKVVPRVDKLCRQYPLYPEIK
jgi:glycine hydroxymethyltransferase